MARLQRKIKTPGLPPGTPVHLGEQKVDRPRMWGFNFSNDKFEEKALETVEDCLRFRDQEGVSWINVDGLHDVALLESLGTAFGLHPLVFEDLANTQLRPKLEDYESYLFLAVKMIDFSEKTFELNVEQVSIILGKGYVLTFQERPTDVFSPVRERIRNNKARIRKMGADYLVYSLLDIIVDNYFVILEKVGARLETLEGRLLYSSSQKTLHDVHNLKGELITLRKSVWPLREVISAMQRMEFGEFSKNTRFFLRDLHDHTIQVIDTIESFRDVTVDMVDLYLSASSNRLNEIIKVLTLISTIFIPLTFITGIYGMNFKYMPELDLTWSYPFVWLVMISLSLFMVWYFRKKKWI